MSSTSIIHFIVIIIIIIHCHHHSLSSSSTVIISTFSTALAAFSQSTMRHVRLKSIAFSASRHRLMILTMRRVSLINDCNLISVCVKVCGEWSYCTVSFDQVLRSRQSLTSLKLLTTTWHTCTIPNSHQESPLPPEPLLPPQSNE